MGVGEREGTKRGTNLKGRGRGQNGYQIEICRQNWIFAPYVDREGCYTY